MGSGAFLPRAPPKLSLIFQLGDRVEFEFEGPGHNSEFSGWGTVRRQERARVGRVSERRDHGPGSGPDADSERRRHTQ